MTDIIPHARTGPVNPKLICVHAHAVLASATTWLTRLPVCIGQVCPIGPLPSSLTTQTVLHLYIQHREPFQKIKIALNSRVQQIWLFFENEEYRPFDGANWNLRHIYKIGFLIFWAVFCAFGFKVWKKYYGNMTQKIFFLK